MDVNLSQLYIFPIKGCRGIALTEAMLAATGLEVDGIGDREWVIVDADGEFLSQREYPKLALVETRMTPSSLRVKAPGMLQLEVPFASEGDVVKARVWNDTVAAVTQGEIADAWLSNYLGIPARLLRFDPEHRRLASPRWTGMDEAPYKFADAFPLLVTNEASLADLNRRLQKNGHTAVDMQRFRPNVVLSGLEAYEEDYVDRITIGEVTLRVVKPCARCSVPGVDPATGEHSTIVPDLLATYRGRTTGEPQGVMFGVNAIVTADAGSTLRVGSAAQVELRL
jgi:uncharacterized protein YcbX